MRQQITQHPVPRRASAPVEEIPDSYFQQRNPSSTRRYTTTEGNQVIQQGNRRIVIHEEPPPKLKRHWHPMFFIGLVFFTMVIGGIAFTLLGNWWQAKQADWKYGNPRTFQIDQFVGHSDSPDHPNHFVALNDGGLIEVIELNTNPKNDHIYLITTVTDSLTPVSLNFADINHDGKVDMIVTIGVGNSYSVVLLNDGAQFKPQQ
ncbi:MAG: hypothetical protein ACR2H5_21855 [Ktedonobacteraceae bacterium]